MGRRTMIAASDGVRTEGWAPALLEILHLQPGAKVGMAVEKRRLIVEPQKRPRYRLDELLAQCNPRIPRSKEEREWLESKPAGGELI